MKIEIYGIRKSKRKLKEEKGKVRETKGNYYVDQTTLSRYQNADWRLRPLPHEMIRYLCYWNLLLVFVHLVL